MHKLFVLYHQNLFDISIQEFGNIEALFDIAMVNGLSITDDLVAGQELIIPKTDYLGNEIYINYDVKKEFEMQKPVTSKSKTNNYTTASGIGHMIISSTFKIG